MIDFFIDIGIGEVMEVYAGYLKYVPGAFFFFMWIMGALAKASPDPKIGQWYNFIIKFADALGFKPETYNKEKWQNPFK